MSFTKNYCVSLSDKVEMASSIVAARNYAKKEMYEPAEGEYLRLIERLRSKFDITNDNSVLELITTEVEYLVFKAKYLSVKNESEKSRMSYLDAIRLLFTAATIQNDATLHQKLEELKLNYISVFGCIIPESATHITISCPIKISTMGAGKMGLSVGMFVNRAVCSICEKDFLECNHKAGFVYDGKVCSIVAKDITGDHISLVHNPKDPNARITSLSIPKKDVHEDLIANNVITKDEFDTKTKKDFGLICNLCREEKRNPASLSFKQFMEMQGLSLTNLDFFEEPLFSKLVKQYSIVL